MSNAQQIKVFYKEVLEDQREHSRIELFNYAKRKSNNLYTDGMLTGALRTLVTDQTTIFVCAGGWYKRKKQRRKNTGAKFSCTGLRRNFSGYYQKKQKYYF